MLHNRSSQDLTFIGYNFCLVCASNACAEQRSVFLRQSCIVNFVIRSLYGKSMGRFASKLKFEANILLPYDTIFIDEWC